MDFKKYIVIEGNFDGRTLDSFSIKIKKGITSEELKTAVLNTWEPTGKKERPYFFSGCSVPRFKVREKWNVTIKPEYATAAFISADGLKGTEDMFDVYSDMQRLNGKKFGEWLTKIYSKQHHFVVKYHSLLLNCEDDIILHEDVLYRCGWNTPQDALTATPMRDWEDDDSWRECSWFQFYTPARNSSLSKLTCPIYSQDAILKLLNVDNLVIDIKKYEELRLMANSSDEENIILVMELMANADYKKSFVYLLCLLKEFNSKIIARKKEVNHVNFKALLHFLDLDKRKLDDVTIEQMVTGMKKHKQFTRPNLQRITQFFALEARDINKHTPDNYLETAHFTAGPVLRADMESELDYEVEEDEVQIPTPEPTPEPEENFNL
jgi:hypothetical protein